jgi:hypothetical protein
MSGQPKIQRPSQRSSQVCQNARVEVKDDTLQDALDRLPGPVTSNTMG